MRKEDILQDNSGKDFIRQAMKLKNGVVTYTFSGEQKYMAVAEVPATGWLARAGLSTIIFFFSRNLWVTMAAGALVPYILYRWRARHA